MSLFPHIDIFPHPDIIRSAEFSPCRTYRWSLHRSWLSGTGTVAFVMLNPSTADENIDDPTIRRCIGFARRWGYRSLAIRNLFPYRSTNPKELLAALDPSGGAQGLREAISACTADCTVVAWGAHPLARHRSAVFLDIVATHWPTKHLYCLGMTKTGYPLHPLYIRANTELTLFHNPFPECE